MPFNMSLDSMLKTGALVTMIASGVTYMTVLKNQINNIETATTVDRIVRLYKIQCTNPDSFNHDLQVVLDQSLARYEELVGRNFSKGRCSTD